MFKTKYIISVSIITISLIITSIVKNETRIIEKKISILQIEILSKKNNINEAQLDFFYLTSPAEIEKKLNLIGFEKYQPIKHSNIYLDISDFNQMNNKISNLNQINEKKDKKK